MDQFIWRAQSVDNMLSDLNSENSVKRCVQLSPSSHQPSKSLSKDNYATWKLWCGWAAIKGGDRPTRLLPHTQKLLVPIRFFPLLGRLCSGRFYIFTEQMWFSLLVSCWEVSAHIDLLWFLFVVGRICPLMQKHFLWSLLKRKAFYCGWTRVLIFCQVLFGSE